MVTPNSQLSGIMEILYEYEGEVKDIIDWGSDRVKMIVDMPLRELMRNFFDRIKSVSSGYASVSYQEGDMREAKVVRMDVYLAEELVPAFSRIVPEIRVDKDADEIAEKLYKILPPE
ncbi:MAG: hypothetical protein QM532_00060 [Cyanobium sp. MAG06]|nr:hypothetical protein [Cyanobium sp. MAG06]